MPVGFEARTESGNVIQIDENYPVLCLRYTGSATVVNRHPASLNQSAFVAKTVDITVTGESPQFFIQASSGRFGVIAVSQTGNQWTFRVIGFEDQPTFTYFIFDRPIVTASGAAALEVRNAQNQVVFSSLWRPMVVAGFTTGNQTAQLPGGRAYAYGFGSRITLQEYSETFTDQSVWTYWTYRLATASAAAQPGSSAIYGTVFDDAIAGGVNQGGQSPVSPSGTLGGWGADSTLTVIDVTDLVGAPGGTTAPVVSVNTTFRTVTGAGGTTITDAVTCSASGGAGGPYSFQWDKTGGDSAIVFYGASNTASLRTQWVNQPAGTSAQAQFRCRVTDAGGNVSYSQSVTFEHKQVVSTADYTPNAISVPNLGPYVTDAHELSTEGRFFQITGINRQIWLRFIRTFNELVSTGNIETRRLQIFHSTVGSGGPWTQVNLGAGTAANPTPYVDVACNNGDWFYVQGYMNTTQGRATVSWPNQIDFHDGVTVLGRLATFTISATLDNDNNYNVVDTAPDVIAGWPAINQASNDHYYEFSTSHYGNHFITGVTAPFTLRAQALNYSGDVDLLTVKVYLDSGSGWYVAGSFDGRANGWVDIPNVQNGWKVALNAETQTNNGRRSANVQLVLWSMTGSAATLFANTSHTFTVDADNNYFQPDYSLNPMNWGDTTASDNGPQVAAGNGYLTLSGINQPISVRYAVVGGTSHNFTGGGVQFYKNGTYQGEIGLSVNANVTHHNLVNGDQISFVGYGSTTSGKRQGSICVHVVNASTEEFIDAFWFHLTADADDNYNTSSAPSLTFNSTYVYKNEFAWSGQNYGVWSDPGAINVTVNGGQGPFTYAWTKLTDNGGSWNVNGTTQPQFYCAGYTTFQHYAQWRLIVTDALGRTAQGIVEVTLGAGDQA